MAEPSFKLRKIWTDVDFFEVRLEFYTNEIYLSQDIYTSNEALDELRLGIINFADQLGRNEFVWTSGHDMATHYLSLRFFLQDKRGIVGIEVNLDNNLEPPYSLHSNFYLITELNQLDDLSRKLQRLIREEINELEGLKLAN